MSRRKEKGGRLSVFKGREARLNKAIFHILALKGPAAIYEICKEVRTQKRSETDKIHKYQPMHACQVEESQIHQLSIALKQQLLKEIRENPNEK